MTVFLLQCNKHKNRNSKFDRITQTLFERAKIIFMLQSGEGSFPFHLCLQKLNKIYFRGMQKIKDSTKTICTSKIKGQPS